MSLTDEILIGGQGWRPEELAALVAAARTLARNARPCAIDGREVAAPRLPDVRTLLEALDAPYLRREPADPALAAD